MASLRCTTVMPAAGPVEVSISTSAGRVSTRSGSMAAAMARVS